MKNKPIIFKMNFQDLPDEIIEEIMTFLTGPNLLTLACVNKQCAKLCTENNRVWKTLCDSDWKNLTGIQPIYEVENGEIEWKSVYQQRQIEFNQWKSSLYVRKWLITDYLKLMWFFFVNPRNQPLFLPEKTAQEFIQATITSGSILINFIVFLPMLFLSLIYKWYSLIFIPYLFIMSIITILWNEVNLSDLKGIILFTSYILLSVVSLLLCYTNDLIMIFCMIFTLSITLSLAHSMKHMIKKTEQIDNIYQGTSTNMLVISVLSGSLIGIAGIRFIVIIIVILFALLTGTVPNTIIELIGIKGVLMIVGCLISIFLYYTGMNSIGENFIKRDRNQLWVSRILFMFILLCNFVLFSKYIMIQHFGFQRLYFSDFNWENKTST